MTQECVNHTRHLVATHPSPWKDSIYQTTPHSRQQGGRGAGGSAVCEAHLPSPAPRVQLPFARRTGHPGPRAGQLTAPADGRPVPHRPPGAPGWQAAAACCVHPPASPLPPPRPGLQLPSWALPAPVGTRTSTECRGARPEAEDADTGRRHDPQSGPGHEAGRWTWVRTWDVDTPRVWRTGGCHLGGGQGSPGAGRS